VKYWEFIVNKIIKAGFSVGWVSASAIMGAQFGLWGPTARESVSSCVPMKS